MYIILDGHVSNCNDFDFDETREIWSDLERTITAHDRRASGTRTQITLFTNHTHNQQHPIAVANGFVVQEIFLNKKFELKTKLTNLFIF